jgi:hypothetical protein
MHYVRAMQFSGKHSIPIETGPHRLELVARKSGMMFAVSRNSEVEDFVNSQLNVAGVDHEIN